MNAVFEVAGQSVETSPECGWSVGSGVSHSAAPATLVAWAAERLDPPRIVRLTLDLLRPVCRTSGNSRTTRCCAISGRLDFTARRNRGRGGHGERVEGAAVQPAAAEGTRRDGTRLPLPDDARRIGDEERVSSTVPESLPEGRLRQTGDPRRASTGSERNLVPSQPPIIGGQPISPMMRAAIAADFGNEILSVLDPKEWSFSHGRRDARSCSPPPVASGSS